MITMFIICYRTLCGKSGCNGDTFWGNWLLLFLMIFHHKDMVRSSSAIGPYVANLGAVVTLFEAIGYCCFLWCFITKIWSGHHESWSQCSSSSIGTPCGKSGGSGDTFWQQWVTVIFDDVSQRYGQVIIITKIRALDGQFSTNACLDICARL